jgi:hypothetical protein
MSDLTPAARKMVEEYLARLYDSLSACTEDEKTALITQARNQIEETFDKTRKDEIAAVTTVLRSVGEPDQFAASLRGVPEPKTEEAPKTGTWWHAIAVACTVVVIMEILLSPLIIWAFVGPKPKPHAGAVAPKAAPPATAPPVVAPVRLPPPPPTYPVGSLSSIAAEADLVVRAAKNDLTAAEQTGLRQARPVLAAQLADRNTRPLLDLFAGLPKGSRDALFQQGYLKWKFASLDAARQNVYKQALIVELETSRNQGAPGDAAMSLPALQQAEVGFAGVEVGDAKQKVISWYILFSNRSAPLWVTVVGAQLAGTAPYFQAHLHQIPLLRKMPDSPLPKP